MKKNLNKKVLALLLAFTMVSNVLPVYASSITVSEDTVVEDEFEVADHEEGYYEYSGTITEDLTNVDEDVIEYDEDGGIITESFVGDGVITSVVVEDFEATEEECEHDYLCGHLTLSIDEAASVVTSTGTIASTLRFDIPTTSTELLNRNLTVSLCKDNGVLGTVRVGEGYGTIGDVEVIITATNENGDPSIAGELVYWYNIEMTGVPAGEYNLLFTGDNYRSYLTEDLDINDFSKYVVVGTADGTFTYGDVTGDNEISISDLDAMKLDITSDKNALDLDGDGNVDIMDLTMIQLNIGAEGDAIVYSTSMVGAANKIDMTGIYGATSPEGNLFNIFEVGNQEEVRFENSNGKEVSESNPTVIPITFYEPIEMSEIQIKSPTGDGAIQSGSVEVVYEEDGVEHTVDILFSVLENGELSASLPDDSSLSAKLVDGTAVASLLDDSFAFSLIENSETASNESASVITDTSGTGSNTIVISLGTRVAVKVITVTVEAVESADGTGVDYVAIQEVTFIQDIVPEDPDASNAIINNIKVTESNKALAISWDKCNNVGGYRVRYGTSANNMPYSKTTTTNSISLSGLENLTEYFFVVEATSGSWTGTPSDVHSGTPQPSSKPGAPKDISVTPWDQMLLLSWTEGAESETFNIYLKETDQDDSEYVKIVSGRTSTSYDITGLTNGVSYTFKISGSNIMGEGAACAPIDAIPEPIEVIPPILPVTDQLPTSNVTNVRMQTSSNVDSSSQPDGFSASFAADGDFGTYWVASNWWDSSGFFFTFEEAYDMSYIIYTPRLDGKYPYSIANYSIYVWTEEMGITGTGLKVASGVSTTKYYDENGTLYYVMPFDFTEDVKQLYVSTSEVTGGPRVSISEVTFYEHNSLDSDVKNLFTDDSFTAIKSTVTTQQLDALDARLEAIPDYVINKEVIGDELRFARDLLNGVDGYGYVKDDFVKIDNSKDDRTLSGISPLGVVGLARTDLAIYVDIPEGGSLSIVPSQYNASAGDFKGTSIKLVSGRNIIRVEDLTNISGAIEGGVYYYTYSGPNVEDVKMHVLNYTGVYSGINTVKEVIAVPTLELYDLGLIADADEAQVRKRLTKYVEDFDAYEGKSTSSADQNPINSTEISTRSVLLSVPASGVWSALGGDSTTTEAKVDKLMNTILAWDEVIYITHTLYGDDEGVRQGRQNFRYMRMSATAFMYAAGDHVGIQFGSTSTVINCSPTPDGNDGKANSLQGWGIAHEIGHNLDRVGVLEVTNNIYASIVTAWDGNMGLNTGRVDYTSAFQKVAVGGPGVPNGYFVQLGMYWQLHLAYSNEDPLAFYTSFNKEWKAGTYSNLSGNNRVAAIASKVAGKDLTEFFTQWGVVLSDTALSYMSQYEVEDRKIQYIDDASRVYRLTSGRSGITGDVSYSMTGAFDPVDYKTYNLVVNHEMDTQDLQGFEVYRDDVRIAFITKNSLGNFTYSDTIGSLNNVAFQYSVQGVDKLGNLVGERAYGAQVRIEYDNLIDTSAYDIEEVEGGYKYIFKDPTTTSGFIINNAPATGNFEVTIAVEAEEESEAETESEEVETESEEAETESEEVETESEEAETESEEAETESEEVETESENVETNSDDVESDENDIEDIEVFTIDTMTSVEYIVGDHILAKSGDYSKNETLSGDKFKNYYHKPGAASDDTTIGVYDALEIIITGDIVGTDVQFIAGVDDNVVFTDYMVGRIGHDFDTGGGILEEGDIIIIGEYLGDPYFNEIVLYGKFGVSSTDEVNVEYVERAMAGSTYMFATVPESGMVSVITDGLFIFRPDVQNESELQGVEEGVTCGGVSLLPAEMKAVMNRTSSTGDRQTSATMWQITPTDDTLPTIILQ